MYSINFSGRIKEVVYQTQEIKMDKLNHSGMKKITNRKRNRADNLHSLTDKPFNINNTDQVSALNKYLDDFELNVNQMYLFQGLSSQIKTHFAAILIGSVALPGFINSVLTSSFYLIIMSHFLQKYKMDEFHNQLNEMKKIYNWCLKNGQEVYSCSIDNTTKLANPDIQRLIKMLAPLCSRKFICVWPNITEKSEPKSALGTVIEVSRNIYSRFFITNPQSDQLKLLQTKVEKDDLSLNAFQGLCSSISFFTSKERIKAQASKSIEYVKELPETLISGISHYKHF